ncbi:MAG: amidohydrolase family protein [Actinobacteria bacterium]|nr:amidohydrolase family protein [Actinomycetota bacterium]
MAGSPLRFTDTHVHFFAPGEAGLEYSWLREGGDPGETEVLGEYGSIRAERYWPEDFVAESRFCEPDAVIHVQAAVGTPEPISETRWLQECNERLGVPAAAIAAADLSAPGVEEVLEEHLRFPIMRGIRDLRYDDYLSNPDWERGFALLGPRGLVCCDDPQIGEAELARDLARRHPDVTVCLDHALVPSRRDDEYFVEWRRALRVLAAVENTVIKISGLGMCDHRWTVESLRPWVLACIEEFGAERAFFGTNWPVDRLYSSYPDLLGAYEEIISGFSRGEQEALFAGNANRIFRVGDG